MGLFGALFKRKRPLLEKNAIEYLVKHGFTATGDPDGPVRYTDTDRQLWLNGMSHFGKGCFYGCDTLVSLLYTGVSREVITVHTGAFESCANLETVEIRSFEARIEVEAGAFRNCPKLKNVYLSCYGSRPIVAANAFENCLTSTYTPGSANSHTHGM